MDLALTDRTSVRQDFPWMDEPRTARSAIEVRGPALRLKIQFATFGAEGSIGFLTQWFYNMFHE